MLERNAVSNAQYHPRESLEINPAPASIGDDNLQNSVFLFVCLFVLIGIPSMQGGTANTKHEVTRKRSTKRFEHTGNLFRKKLQLEDIC